MNLIRLAHGCSFIQENGAYVTAVQGNAQRLEHRSGEKQDGGGTESILK